MVVGDPDGRCCRGRVVSMGSDVDATKDVLRLQSESNRLSLRAATQVNHPRNPVFDAGNTLGNRDAGARARHHHCASIHRTILSTSPPPTAGLLRPVLSVPNTRPARPGPSSSYLCLEEAQQLVRRVPLRVRVRRPPFPGAQGVDVPGQGQTGRWGARRRRSARAVLPPRSTPLSGSDTARGLNSPISLVTHQL
ncbi:hypothetical protein LX36DRAFT_68002 [Colletotrichum falcatum]|nr:hypothetical protein LX36DRAFT_68002 [Colletotrichum falcatum]